MFNEFYRLINTEILKQIISSLFVNLHEHILNTDCLNLIIKEEWQRLDWGGHFIVEKSIFAAPSGGQAMYSDTVWKWSINKYHYNL